MHKAHRLKIAGKKYEFTAQTVHCTGDCKIGSRKRRQTSSDSSEGIVIGINAI